MALAETLCMQLLFWLRERCRQFGLKALKITDRGLSPLVTRVTGFDGFRVAGNARCSLVVEECGPAAAVELAVHTAAAEAGIDTTLPIVPNLPAEQASELERLFWPAKITDSLLQTWIVPIRRPWASRLFNSPEALEPRDDKLGISREHVYYNSGWLALAEPARIVWYRSGQEHGGGQLFGCSRLAQVLHGPAEELHGRFGYLGVFGINDVREAASTRGVAQALRFTDTEIFPRGISLETYRTISGQSKETFVSARRIPPWVFDALYRRAYRIGETRRDP